MNGARTGATSASGSAQLSPLLRVVGTIGVILALALASVDVSIVGTAMPRIVNDLGGLEYYAWVGITYGVASVVVIPIAGKLGDMFGRKPFLLAGLFGFMVASFLCGASQSMLQLSALRGLQGLFAGVLMVSIFTVVADLFTAEKRAQMQGVLFSVAGLSMVVGPLLGGLITDSWSWRWVFYVNLVVGVLSAIAVAVAVPYIRSQATVRDIDVLGVLALIAGLVPILVGLSLIGNGEAWSSPGVLALLLGGAALLVAFFLVETRRAANPIVPFGMFRNRTFAVLIAVAFFSAFAMGGTVFYVPLLYQGVLGVSATYSGSLVVPLTLALMVIPPIAGRLLTTISRYRYLGTFAFACMVAGLLLLTQVDQETSRLLPVLAMVLVGVGVGVAFPMATTVAQSAVSREQLGVATSQMQFWRILAGPMTFAILGSVLASRIGDASQAALVGGGGGVSAETLAAGMHQLFLVAAVLVAIGLVATLALREVPLRQPAGPAGGKARSEPPAKQPTGGR